MGEVELKPDYEKLIERLQSVADWYVKDRDATVQGICTEAAEAISTLLKERDAALAGQCVHEWEWVKTAVDMSNTNFVTMRCSKCGTTRYEEHLGGVGSGGGSLPRA
jgi:formylmethanofuran dehydrogenase subunit E